MSSTLEAADPRCTQQSGEVRSLSVRSRSANHNLILLRPVFCVYADVFFGKVAGEYLCR